MGLTLSSSRRYSAYPTLRWVGGWSTSAIWRRYRLRSTGSGGNGGAKRETRGMDDVAIEMRGILEREYAPSGQVVPYSELATKVTTRLVLPRFMDKPLAAISRETAA